MIVLLIKSFGYTEALLAFAYGLFFLTLTADARRELGLRVWLVFAILTIFCFFAPALLVIHLIAFAIIPMMGRTRRDVALLLIVAMLATPAFNSVITFEGLKLVRWSVQNSLGLGALFAFAIARGPIMRRQPRADTPFYLLMLLLVVVAARESSVTNFLRELSTALVSFAVPYWVITRGINPSTDTRRLLLWISAAAAMIGVVAIYEAMTAWPLYRTAGSLFDQRGSGMFVMRMGFMRAAGPLSNSTVLGFVLAFAFVAAILARPAFRTAGHQSWVVAAIAGGIIASQSRGAMLGAAIAAMLLAIYNPRNRNGTLAFVAIGMAGIFSLLMIGLTYYEATAAETLSYRRQLVQRGVEEFWKHPFAGDTIAAVTQRMSDLTTGEHIVDFVNTYLYFALFTGIFGVLTFLYLILRQPVSLWRMQRRLPANRDHMMMARFCFAILLSSALMLGFTSLSDRMATILIAVAGLAGSITAPRRQAKQEAAVAPPLDGMPIVGLPTGTDEIRLPQIREGRLPGI